MTGTIALPLLLFFTPQTNPSENPKWNKTRSIAESQHEIVMILIRNRQFDKVLAATREIFSLKFPDKQEHLFAREGLTIADALINREQYELADRVLSEALKCVKSARSRVSLYKEKAYLCKKLEKDDEAMEHFRRAKELEKSSP